MPEVVERIGGYSAVIDVQPPASARLYWQGSDGRKLKRAPVRISQAHPERYRQIRQKLRSIKNTLKAQTRRIESFYSNDEPMSYQCWQAHYATHPLMKVITGSLIWLFKEGSRACPAMLQDGQLVSAEGRRIPALSGQTQVSLWHPLHSDRQEREAWRNYVWRHAIVQPFRQAYREVYQADGDSDLGAIVSGLCVRQHPFRALLLERGWRYRFRGSFDSDSTPLLNCPGGLQCEIGISSASRSVSGMGISIAVELSGFSFSRHGKKLAAAMIPPILYSEVLRDIDLFTAVSGIGYRRDWEDIEALFVELAEFRVQERLARPGQSTPDALKNMLNSAQLHTAMAGMLTRLEAAIGDKPVPETVRTRGCLLQALLHGSPLAHQIRIDDRYVFVDGPRGSYRINMASGLVFDCGDNTLAGAVQRTGNAAVPGEAGTDSLLAGIYDTIVSLAGPGKKTQSHNAE